jgi:fluoride exporter
MKQSLVLWLAVSCGGALGTAARFGTNLLCKSLPVAFPLATLAVNTLGCLVMGLVMGHLSVRPAAPDLVRLTLTTGILGGFTTFSAFSMETVLLWRETQPALALANIAANVVLSLAACAAKV